MTDLSQERGDACKVCGHFLPKRKTKFCSDYCASRFRGWKKPSTRIVVDFLRSISKVTWIEPAEKRPFVDHPDGIYRAGDKVVLVRRGRVIAFGPPCVGTENALKCEARGRADRLAESRYMENQEKREAERAAVVLRKQQRLSAAGSFSLEIQGASGERLRTLRAAVGRKR